MSRTMKTAEQMERHFKGMANHHRINILLLVEARDGISVEKISEVLDVNLKTISQHARYLFQTGLIRKKYKGRVVEHSLSPYGKLFVRFIKEFRNMST